MNVERVGGREGRQENRFKKKNRRERVIKLAEEVRIENTVRRRKSFETLEKILTAITNFKRGRNFSGE